MPNYKLHPPSFGRTGKRGDRRLYDADGNYAGSMEGRACESAGEAGNVGMSLEEFLTILNRKIKISFYQDERGHWRRDRNWMRDQNQLNKALLRYAYECERRGWQPAVEDIFNDLQDLLIALETQEHDGKGARTWFPKYLEACVDKRVNLQAEKLNRTKEAPRTYTRKIVDGLQVVEEIRTPVRDMAALYAAIRVNRGGRKKKKTAKPKRKSTKSTPSTESTTNQRRTNMQKPYFVMLYNQSGSRLVPLLDESGMLAMYATVEEAKHAAKRTVFGEHFGYDIFEAGYGV